VRLPTRRNDDADIIRARLRALLQEGGSPRGWLPEDEAPDADDVDDPERREPVSADDAGAALPEGVGRHRAPGAAARWDPGRPAARAMWLAGIVAALVLVAWTWLDRPRVEPAHGETARSSMTGSAGPPDGPGPATPVVGEVAETASTVVVSVVGLVAQPGLVTLPSGARVADAIAAAGGLLPEADPATVNLAAVVADGEQIAVGVAGSASGGSPAGSAATGGPVNLNTATVTDLDALPGIGPVLAQRIVDHRERNGRFASVHELNDVAGIGPAIFAGLSELVMV
jgi:competence protein ComEA